VILIIVGLIYFNRNYYYQLPYIPQDPLTSATTPDRTEDFSENRNAYFGDLHIHTSWSFDAFIYNVRANPDDAYRYGRGHKIPHVSGDSIQINRPLDFMAVTDHAEYMSVMVKMLDEDSPFAQLDISERVKSSDESVSRKAIVSVGMSIGLNKPHRALIDEEVMYDTWKKVVRTADKYYEPGTFTTFPAYEWTSHLQRW